MFKVIIYFFTDFLPSSQKLQKNKSLTAFKHGSKGFVMATASVTTAVYFL